MDIDYELDEESTGKTLNKTSNNTPTKMPEKPKRKTSSQLLDEILAASGDPPDMKQVIRHVKALPKKQMIQLLQQLKQAGYLNNMGDATNDNSDDKTSGDARENYRRIMKNKKMTRTANVNA